MGHFPAAPVTLRSQWRIKNIMRWSVHKSKGKVEGGKQNAKVLTANCKGKPLQQ